MQETAPLHVCEPNHRIRFLQGSSDSHRSPVTFLDKLSGEVPRPNPEFRWCDYRLFLRSDSPMVIILAPGLRLGHGGRLVVASEVIVNPERRIPFG